MKPGTPIPANNVKPVIKTNVVITNETISFGPNFLSLLKYGGMNLLNPISKYVARTIPIIINPLNFAGVSKYVANAIDSKIYIGDEAGQVACLRPIE